MRLTGSVSDCSTAASERPSSEMGTCHSDLIKSERSEK